MKDPITIKALLSAIRKLPADPPVSSPGTWYLTQHEHWIGWLSEYHGEGAYGRQVGQRRDAKFAYNHVVNPQMLLYLANAAGVDRKRVLAAEKAFATGTTMMQQSGAIRKIIPWELAAAALWPNYSSQCADK